MQILVMAFGLGMDSFAISAAVGMGYRPVTGRTFFRIAWHFAVFQAGLLALGWWGGRFLNVYFSQYDHWVAAAILAAIGGHMCLEARGEKPPEFRSDPSRGLRLVFLSTASSIDALAVGASLGLLAAPIQKTVVILGLMTAAMCVVGLELGRKVGRLLGRWAYLVGGAALVGLAVKIVVDHLRPAGG